MPGNNGPMLLAVQWTLWVLATFVMLIRIRIRLHYLRTCLTAADWIMILALLCETAAACLVCVSVRYGLGRHLVDLHNVGDIVLAIKWGYFLSVFNLFAPMFGRLSFVVFLLQLLPPQAKFYRISLHTLNVVQLGSVAITIIMLFSQCGSHIEALWDIRLDWKTYCHSKTILFYMGYITAALHAACDLWLTILPLLITRKLNMAPSIKRALAAVLCLSGFAFVGSVTRVSLLVFLSQPDALWYSAYLVLCITVESNIVIICASMPVLRVLWKDQGVIRSNRSTSDPNFNAATAGVEDHPYELPPHGSNKQDASSSSSTTMDPKGIADRRGSSKFCAMARSRSQSNPKWSLRKDLSSDTASQDYILDQSLGPARTNDTDTLNAAGFVR